MSKIGTARWLAIGAAMALTACASNQAGSSATAYGDVGPESQVNGVWLDSAGGLWLDSVGVIHHGRRGRPAELYGDYLMGMTNANIVAHILVDDSLEANLSALGVARATNPEVRAFAQRMLDTHTAHRASSLDVSTRGGLKPLISSRDTVDIYMATHMASSLDNLSGEDWDRGFMSEQVMENRHILADLKLLRDHSSGVAEELVDQTIPIAKANQDDAQKLWRKIGGKGSQYGTSAFPGGKGGH